MASGASIGLATYTGSQIMGKQNPTLAGATGAIIGGMFSYLFTVILMVKRDKETPSLAPFFFVFLITKKKNI